MDCCSIGSWNVRGLNNKGKQEAVLEFCNVNKIGIGGLLETKLKGNKVQELMDIKFTNWEFHTSPIVEGRLLIIWRKSFVKVVVLAESTQHVHSLKRSGSNFTWTNNQDGSSRIYSKIDHGFVNEEWHDSFPNTAARFSWEATSDHCSCVISASATKTIGIKPFRFFNFLAEHHDFKLTVEQSWKRPVSSQGLKGIYIKLMRVKHCLKMFNHEVIGDIGKRFQDAKTSLSEAKLQVQAHPSDTNYQELETEATANYDLQEKMYHKFLSQRSKITWLQKGDSNTSYFHAFLKKRRMDNRIVSFMTEQGIIVDKFSDVVEHFLNHFRSFMGSNSSVTSRLNLSCLEQGAKLSLDQQVGLLKPFSVMEIKKAMFSIPDIKSP
ncbi:uncharacterized protein LOC133791849 [Humulus lupulus]|uniref:uncharacterized protein LOC133791849 n=1 Tax=Humulus lupulus TaxID=3486 RepID=UPI002B416911|nr:uncharacterized protein LOC133791849 [Humulus lupulus]